MKKYAISDIHGCLRSLEALLGKIAFSTTDELYLLGDYIDRGPCSRQVIDLILRLRKTGYQIRTLAGNHDFALLDAKVDPAFRKDWMDGWGGKQTMESFGSANMDDIPQHYFDFVTGLEIVLETDGYILVHAGLNFGAKDPLKPDVTMFFLRNWHQRIRPDWLNGRVIVHGHTPITTSESAQMLEQIGQKGVIDIDTGCFATHLPGKGHLTALDLTNRQLFTQPCLDDVSGYWQGRRGK